MLSRFAWFRKQRGGRWVQTSGLLWGKRWIRLPELPQPNALDAQICAIHGFAIDLGMSKTLTRHYVSAIVHRPIHFMAELTFEEAVTVIGHLDQLQRTRKLRNEMALP